MPAIRKMPNGKYRAVVSVKGVNTISRTFPTRALAERFAAVTYEQMVGRRYFGDGYNMTFNELCAQYIQTELPLRQSYDTQYKTECRLDAWLKPFGSMLVSHIRPHNIMDVRNTWSKENGWSPSYLNLHVSSLSTCLAYAVSREIIADNPCAKIRALPTPPAKDRVLLREEEIRLFAQLACIDTDTYLCTLFALNTGARRGEVTKLRKVHFNEIMGTVTFTHTKNKKDRTIPISEHWISFFSKQGDGFRFIFRDGYWRKALERAAITNFRFHDLRHTFITRAIASGKNPAIVAAYVGHSSLNMTNYYTHFGTDDLRQII